MHIVKQSVPISLPMTHEIIALRRLLHGDQTVKRTDNEAPVRAITDGLDRGDGGQSAEPPDWFDRQLGLEPRIA